MGTAMSESAYERVKLIQDSFPTEGLFKDKHWRITPYPFVISKKTSKKIYELGNYLLNYLRACNTIYHQSLRGKAPDWIASYLDAGKPKYLIEQGKHKSYTNDIPKVIRPDLILNEESFAITELDSVPGGIGLTAWLNKTYSSLGDNIIGGPMGMIEGFKNILPRGGDILISKEASDYKPEMEWLTKEINDSKTKESYEVLNAENYKINDRDIYRFYELFDLKNIPTAEDIFDHSVSGRITMTSPHKAYLEEKMWSALLHSRALRENWMNLIRQSQLNKLQSYIPYSWIIDPGPVPHYAELPGLGINNWNQLNEFSKTQRELVLKISGYSELAWGSRSVKIGHDLSSKEWKKAVETAISDFPKQPWILQKHIKSKVFEHPFWDIEKNKIIKINVRARLCPYFFVSSNHQSMTEVALGGILATLVPSDKKIIHGMSEAIMAPCIEE